jgi:thiol-disulfide isomerase/thioredoxin
MTRPRLAALPLLLLVLLPLTSLACASAPPVKMGVVSDLSRVEGPAEFCDHKVPEQVCTRHHPELIPKFKAVNDWCPPHEVPESQCFICHPDLTFEALPRLRKGADLAVLARAGEDVGDLGAHAVPGKVTVFDFYADWCVACREIDLHAYKLLNARDDLAVRKLNVVDWDTPLARRHLSSVEGLPFVVVYGKDRKPVRSIQGVKLPELTQAIDEGAAR